MKNEIVIVSGIRTPIGSFQGTLKQIEVNSLGAIVLKEAINRISLNATEINEVIMGNVIQTSPRGNPARESLLEAGYLIEVPGFTVNKNCGSGLKSIALGSLMVKSGEHDIIVAGGMENMSKCPYIIDNARNGFKMGDATITDFLTSLLEGMGMTAERIAERYKISRYEQDRFAYTSHMRAYKAQKEGRFDEQIIPIKIGNIKKSLETINYDESIKPNTTIEKLSSLTPVFRENGSVTAGNSSTINDGAAAVVIMSSHKAKMIGLKPLVKIKAWASAACEPEFMGMGPVPAIKRVLKKAKMSLNEIDLFEINEAFAAQVLGVLNELSIDIDKVNVNGGAISMGHPVGATGSILTIKLIGEMKRRQAQTGLVSLCIGGGQGISMILENI